ncbi:MAG: transcriptional regulator [Bacteroidales bacterium]|nr:transcriptional regulator [Bacteroidales bacterium]
MDNKDKVVKTFQESEKPLKPGEVSEITGIDSKEISKIITQLKTEGIIDSPKRCYYAIKK